MPPAENFQPVPATAQLARLPVPADIDLHGGLGEREIGGPEADRQRGDAEEGAQEIDQAAFEVGQRDVAVEADAFALVEHRRMRGVMVGAVGAAGGDHAERRFLREHGDDLHVAGLRAQQQRAAVALALHVERVVVGAGGMVRRDVQRAEIVPVGLDIEALADAETHGAEDRRHLLHGAADRVDETVQAGRRRQADIDALGGELGLDLRLFELRAPRVDRGGQLVLEPVERGPTLAPLLGGGGTECFQQLCERPLLAERGHAHRVPCTQVWRGFERTLGLGAKGREVVGHQ